MIARAQKQKAPLPLKQGGNVRLAREGPQQRGLIFDRDDLGRRTRPAIPLPLRGVGRGAVGVPSFDRPAAANFTGLRPSRHFNLDLIFHGVAFFCAGLHSGPGSSGLGQSHLTDVITLTFSPAPATQNRPSVCNRNRSSRAKVGTVYRPFCLAGRVRTAAQLQRRHPSRLNNPLVFKRSNSAANWNHQYQGLAT